MSQKSEPNDNKKKLKNLQRPLSRHYLPTNHSLLSSSVSDSKSNGSCKGVMQVG